MYKFAKGLFATTVAMSLQAGAASFVSAAPPAPISVQVDGKTLTFDQAPVSKNNRTLVPLRAIFEALGAEVTWNPQTKSVTASKENHSVSLQIGSKNATVDQKAVVLDVEAQLINGRTLVPVRFVSEAMGTVVNWDEKTKNVSILTTVPPVETKPEQPVQPTKPDTQPKPETPTSPANNSGSNPSSGIDSTTKPVAPSLQDKLLGKWETNYSGFNIDVTFSKDNKASLLSGTYQGSYTVTDDKMTLSVPKLNKTTSGTVNFVSEKEFTVTSASGNVATFTRK